MMGKTVLVSAMILLLALAASCSQPEDLRGLSLEEFAPAASTAITVGELGHFRPVHVLAETTADVMEGRGGFESASENGTLAEFLATTEASDTAVLPEPQGGELYYTVYRVRKGDMIGSLAQAFGVTQDTLISVNNIKQSRLIQIGQYLRIPNIPGVLYTVRKDGETVSTIAKDYRVSPEKCSQVNALEKDEALKAGTQLFVPDAALDWVTRQEINGDLFVRPIKKSYYISSRFGWRASPFTGERSYHSGIDLACVTGTPIYAALAGRVTTAGWSDIYGNYVIVTHHSGYKTLYGHMKEITCSVGQYVTTSSIVGRVGSTGYSTGPHLHFTVYKNGKAVNPASLWN